MRKLQKLSSPLPSPTAPNSPYNAQSSNSNIPNTPTPATPRPRATGGHQPLGRAATMVLPVTPRWSSSQSQPAAEDDVNVEYLKNVLLNFIEHRDRRVSVPYCLFLWVSVPLILAQMAQCTFLSRSHTHTLSLLTYLFRSNN